MDIWQFGVWSLEFGVNVKSQESPCFDFNSKLHTPNSTPTNGDLHGKDKGVNPLVGKLDMTRGFIPLLLGVARNAPTA